MSGPCTDCGGPDYQTLEARIAEMEEQLADCAKTCGGLEYRLEQALARITELKARRCETCKSYDVDTRFCAALTQHWHPNFYCAGWAEGITP